MSSGSKIPHDADVPAFCRACKYFLASSAKQLGATPQSPKQQLGRCVTEPHPSQRDSPTELAGDLLRGAEEIAAFIFGEGASPRKVYYLAECSKLPVFRLGSVLCARRSVLLQWIARQENRVLPPRC